MSVVILVVAVLAVIAGVRFIGSDDESDAGCPRVHAASERGSFVEHSGDVPTSKVYVDAAADVRRAVVGAPSAIAPRLQELGDAYTRLGGLLDGFDPNDESSYHIYEDNTPEIEAQQAIVDRALPEVQAWVDKHCD
jgi:alkanesulfonate monooxygenase SsuD/methylene tetrahydromethanopterin reductase-like flavin-dependent oxidoreductase (luciferase family)